MFETQEGLVGVITDGGSLAFLTPSWVGVFSIMRSSDHTGAPTHTNSGQGGKKIGAGLWDRHQIPIVRERDKLFYGNIIQIMSGPSVLLRANWNTENNLNIVRWFDQDFHSRQETHSILFHLGPDRVILPGGGGRTNCI